MCYNINICFNKFKELLKDLNYKRKIIGENIGFSTVIDEKFNTCYLNIRLITELSDDTAAANAVAMGCLVYSNSRLKTLKEMSEQLSSLYGASISSSFPKRGDLQILGMSASWICSKFALDNEDIDGKMLEIIGDCLFRPNIADGGFESEAFRINRKELLDRIDAELNDKRSYAITQASRIAFAGEPAENPESGTRASAEAVTPQSAYEAYLKLLESAQIEIFFVAPAENPDVEKLFSDSFSQIKRVPRDYPFRSVSPVKPQPENVSEEIDVRQCKIALTFKSDSDDSEALTLLSAIYGGTPVSKLFANVRERLSLCYYCACRYNKSKNVIMVDCGVEKNNIGKASEEILRQLDEIRQGNIADAEIQSALLAMENSCISVGDTPYSYVSWYFERFCCGEIKTPSEYFESLRGVTKDRLIKAAASLKLDSTYHMLNKETAQ